MDIDNGDDPFTAVDNDAILQCNHDDMPAYIAPLKAVLTVGHYVFVQQSLVNLLLVKLFATMGHI